MKKMLFATLMALTFLSLSAQEIGLDINKKQITALRAEKAPIIDGDLSDEIWLSAVSSSDFITLDPTFGKKATHPTEVKIIYDNTGIYIAAMMHDPYPDSIGHELVQRDGIGRADWFGVFIDAYMDGINGLEFIVTAAGVQFDAKASANGEDENWDAVWKSAVKIVDNGWTAEMKIPYSALRFPNKETQLWHINFGRKIERSQEKVFWSEINPKIDGFMNQAGLMKGISGIKSPVRLSATPFIAVYGVHARDEEGNNNYGRSFNGGMDIKYGLNDAFTLDLTLIPDFGEARSDNEQLNLGPFEVRYNENRPFFTEGTELFSKGRLFYSRRIGGRPLHYWDVYDNVSELDSVISNPSKTQLYNATKVSGRTSGGLGIGLFNATAGRQTALIQSMEGERYEMETAPLTNYNVLVLDQNLKNNSSVSLINTTVMRSGEEFDANVTGLVFDLLNKKRSYGIEGKAALSQKFKTDTVEFGRTYNIEFKKVSGNFNFGIEYNVEGDTYDPNDLGFIFNNNERSASMWASYNIYKPFSIFNRANFGLWTGYSRLYKPDVYTGYRVNFWAGGQTKNFWQLNFSTYFEPVQNIDYFEPRLDGRYFNSPKLINFRTNIGSDPRKKINIRLASTYRFIEGKGQNGWSIRLRPRYRVNDKLSFGLSTDANISKNQIGFVNHVEGNAEEIDVIFGKRDRKTITNSIFASYTFNNKMTLTFDLYHYWTKGKYNSFHLLEKDGNLGATSYSDAHDFTYNAFNIDLQYRWRFAPGSDIFIVWKNFIEKGGDNVEENYYENVGSLFNGAQRNQLSIKAIYYIDYLYLTKKK